MANIVTAKPATSAGHVSKFGPNVRLPYLVEVEITAAQLIATKGSALAAADTIDVINVPANTVVLGAWLLKADTFAGTSADLALSFGLSGGTANQFVASWVYPGAAVGSYGTAGAGAPAGLTVAAATPMRITVSAQTGTWTGGSIRAQVLLLDLSDKGEGSIVKLGS